MMSDAAGYVTDVAYPDRFHRELGPTWLRAAAIALGFAAPDTARPFRWLELGCGGGLSAMAMAACHPQGRFIAVDFDAAQIERARAAARAAGLDNVEFTAADLRDYAAAQAGGPAFDFIVSHGVWSWVAPPVREAMLEIVRTGLKPGGIACLGYMSHPGAAQMQSVHKLMRECARQAEGDPAARAAAGLELLQRLAGAGAGFFAEHPGARRQLEAMRHEPREYLAHEFLGEHWQPQHAADVIRGFAAADCAYIGSATLLENIDRLSVPGAVQPLLRELPPGPLAETVRDLARNQSLRRDLYQKDAQPLPPQAHLRALDALAYAALPGAPGGGELRFDTRIGPIVGPAELFEPLLQALARGPHSFATLRALPAYAGQPGLLNQLLQTLVWAGCAHPLREGGAAHAAASAIPGLALRPDLGTALVDRR